MSACFTPLRIAIFVACIAVYWFLGGFNAIDAGLSEDFRPHRQTFRAWFMCMAAFVGGAVSVSFIEHKVGHVDPTNLRFAYVVFGIALMLLGILWHQSLVGGLEERFGVEE